MGELCQKKWIAGTLRFIGCSCKHLTIVYYRHLFYRFLQRHPVHPSQQNFRQESGQSFWRWSWSWLLSPKKRMLSWDLFGFLRIQNPCRIRSFSETDEKILAGWSFGLSVISTWNQRNIEKPSFWSTIQLLVSPPSHPGWRVTCSSSMQEPGLQGWENGLRSKQLYAPSITKSCYHTPFPEGTSTTPSWSVQVQENISRMLYICTSFPDKSLKAFQDNLADGLNPVEKQ